MPMKQSIVTLGAAAALLVTVAGCETTSRGTKTGQTQGADARDKLTTPKADRRTWIIYDAWPANSHLKKCDAFRLRKDGAGDYKFRPLLDLKKRWDINQVKLKNYSTASDNILCGEIKKPNSHLDGHILTLTLDKKSDDNVDINIEEGGTCEARGIPGGGGRAMN